MRDNFEEIFKGEPMIKLRDGNVILQIDIIYATIILIKTGVSPTRDSIMTLLKELLNDPEYDRLGKVKSYEFDEYYQEGQSSIDNLFPELR